MHTYYDSVAVTRPSRVTPRPSDKDSEVVVFHTFVIELYYLESNYTLKGILKDAFPF